MVTVGYNLIRKGGVASGSGAALFFVRDGTSLQPEYCPLRLGLFSRQVYPEKCYKFRDLVSFDKDKFRI